MAVVHPSRMNLVPQDPFPRPSSSDRYRRRSPSPRRRPETPPYKGGGADFLEGRRLQRESIEVDVWPPSPKAPARDQSSKRKRLSKRSKRDRSSSVSDDSSSEEERRRRERKERKRARKERERKERREKQRTRSRIRHKSYEDDDSDSERGRRHERRSMENSRSRSRRLSKTRSPSPSRSPEPSEEEWVIKQTPNSMLPPLAPVPHNPDSRFRLPVTQANDDSDEEVGPKPAPKANTSKRIDERAYGSALLRGEGSAMAAFLQEGGTEARIPRRGEIGLTSEEIAKFEGVGYVMSGSRHRRMNAVRMRKENQVISAEEKRGILKLQKEERERRETILREEFSELVKEKLKGAEGKVKPENP